MQKGREETDSTEKKAKRNMKVSSCKSCGELPLSLNATTVAKVPGVLPSSGYELMHMPGFPVLRVGNRMIVPKEKLIQWVEQNTAGAEET